MPAFREQLNKFCQQKWRRHGVVNIEVTDVGTSSDPSFEAVCYINRDEYSKEYGSSIKEAREAAAGAALTLLIQESSED